MEANVKKLVALRVILTICLTAALALIPPVLYHNPLYNVFFLDDAAKEIASRFSDATRWIHAGGIIAVWLLNLVFFSINRKKNDSGAKLMARTGLQNVLNFLLVVLCVFAMIGYRYGISTDTWIGAILPSATRSVAILWLPYAVVAVCALVLWGFCMHAAPAPNCEVSWPIAKSIDKSMKRADPTR